LEGSVLKNILGSMLFAKDLQVLKKAPATKIIDDTHEIEINGAYRSNAKRVSLPAAVMQEKVSVQENVTAEQVHVLESIIVRNMKTRKVMAAQELHRAVMEQCLFFRPDMRMVKQRIEDLMKRGYLAREDPTVHTSDFVYVPGPVDE
jgi:hypothetical protein